MTHAEALDRMRRLLAKEPPPPPRTIYDKPDGRERKSGLFLPASVLTPRTGPPAKEREA